MSTSYLKRGLWFVLLVLVQVLVLNHIHIGGYATPFVYVYFILVLNRDVTRNELLLWGFFLGLVVDVFANTPGMNAAATTLLAFLRPSLLTLFVPRDSSDDWEPGIRSMGFSSFLGYAVLAVLLHHLMLLVMDTFSFFAWGVLALKIVCSTVLTICCVMALESFRRK